MLLAPPSEGTTLALNLELAARVIALPPAWKSKVANPWNCVRLLHFGSKAFLCCLTLAKVQTAQTVT